MRPHRVKTFHRAFGHVASFLALCLLVVVTPARADVRILASPGGEVGSYIKLFSVLRQSGQRVIVDGPCFSACTLVLSSIPRNRICVTQKAVLGFHAPRQKHASSLPPILRQSGPGLSGMGVLRPS